MTGRKDEPAFKWRSWGALPLPASMGMSNTDEKDLDCGAEDGGRSTDTDEIRNGARGSAGEKDDEGGLQQHERRSGQPETN